MPIDPPLIIAVWHRRSASSPLHRGLREKIIGLSRLLNEGEHTAIPAPRDLSDAQRSLQHFELLHVFVLKSRST
ncbi:hypothetical protein SJ05684_c16670 [Sinorhizobium sojae CCBAU 05684]|uniref:Uncharacterized protein n=1 Tax=Sinorhizobium sojae CCBAU 05684 TaxID=716928 RepID=A0A249PCX3_9HYPH|nr:hypothetical protein [Sinorhizobium sojae]ASY63109.1 hypothetical protein SJ05684_c16670 [Sinorhizobium sojae CCBAU 05684]